MSKTVSARIDDNLHTLITDEANQDGKTVNEKLKQVLNNHFEKNEEEKTQENKSSQKLERNVKKVYNNSESNKLMKINSINEIIN